MFTKLKQFVATLNRRCYTYVQSHWRKVKQELRIAGCLGWLALIAGVVGAILFSFTPSWLMPYIPQPYTESKIIIIVVPESPSLPIPQPTPTPRCQRLNEPIARNTIYITQSGDNLSCIAERAMLDLNILLDANPTYYPDPHKVAVGVPITIP